MPQSISIIGVKSASMDEYLTVQKTLKGMARCYEMKVKDNRFKLGSLDSMLLNLEKIKKLELTTENFLKRIDKMYLDICPDKNLVNNKLDSNVGPKDIDIFLKKFEWDDIRYPRSASLFDQIKHIEDKLRNMEKNLKIKQQNYLDSKTIISNNFEKKESLTTFVNKDLNESILDIMKQNKNISPDTFINSDYLLSVIVFIPKQNLEKFIQNYENMSDFIVPRSFVEITQKFGFIMGHVVAFKKAVDDLKISFKDEFKAIAKEFEFKPELAKEKEMNKKKIISQNKTDKELLNSACIETFKEVLVMNIHIKIYEIIIDSSLRFGSLDKFTVVLLFFEKNKQMKVINKMVQKYAEKDKLEFYGTKDQLNDVEDFFPFVWTVFSISI